MGCRTHPRASVDGPGSVRLVLSLLRLSARLLLANWPALMVWYLVGVLGNYVVIEVAGFVGAYTALGGLLLMPLAILARLIAYVAMFLVLRAGMPALEGLAPSPPRGPERRRAFVDAVLAGILPFFAFYAAWGFLREDVGAYLARGLEVQAGLQFGSILTGEEVVTDGTLDEWGFNAVTIGLIVVSFAGRWAWKRYRSRLPKVLAVAAVYLEAVWIFLSVSLIADAIGWVTGWVDSRQAMVWLGDLRAWVSSSVAPIAWIWDGVEWFLGELGGLVLLPIAWLTIAGVIYGQALAASATPRLRGALPERVKSRYLSLPDRLRRRLKDFGAELTSRFRPIWGALVLMWRAGPVLIAGYVLLYTVVLAAESGLGVLLTRLIGPQDFFTFWVVFVGPIFLGVSILIEPMRVVLVAAGYDRSLARLAPVNTPMTTPVLETTVETVVETVVGGSSVTETEPQEPR